jgi:hypothetical protein
MLHVALPQSASVLGPVQVSVPVPWYCLRSQHTRFTAEAMASKQSVLEKSGTFGMTPARQQPGSPEGLAPGVGVLASCTARHDLGTSGVCVPASALGLILVSSTGPIMTSEARAARFPKPVRRAGTGIWYCQKARNTQVLSAGVLARAAGCQCTGIWYLIIASINTRPIGIQTGNSIPA